MDRGGRNALALLAKIDKTYWSLLGIEEGKVRLKIGAEWANNSENKNPVPFYVERGFYVDHFSNMILHLPNQDKGNNPGQDDQGLGQG